MIFIAPFLISFGLMFLNKAFLGLTLHQYVITLVYVMIAYIVGFIVGKELL